MRALVRMLRISRMSGAVVALLLTAFTAAAQNDSPGVTAKPASQASKFRKPAVRAANLRTRAARRLPATAVAPADAAPSATPEGATLAASAARKRGPAPASGAPTPRRDGASSAPSGERVAVQFDLAWAGEYNGLINGEANDKTTAAIRAFQRNRKFKETGVLNTQERALLAAAAKAKQAQVGWTMVDDGITGARLGIPMKQVPNKSQGKSGSRWSSPQGQVQVETFRIREPGTTLAAVYEQQKKEPSTRKLEVNFVRPDFFILSGMQNLKRFYVRAEFKDGEVRGMTVLYDQATETIMDPVAVVMSSAFTPFPGVAGGAGIAQIGAPPRRKVEYGTGIVVSAAGHILTDRQLTEGCNVIVVSGYGDADRHAEDKATDLALLRVYGVPDLVPAAFAADVPKTTDLTLVGIADPQSQEGGGAISAVAVKLKGNVIEPAPQLGFSGGAVLDAQGRVAGVVELKTPIMADVGASGAPPAAAVVPAASIRAFLDAQRLAPATGRAGLDAAKASVVRVICVRK
jgi:peptidoglycan hydrolase-like protein with peptidoglycan-binding domain